VARHLFSRASFRQLSGGTLLCRSGVEFYQGCESDQCEPFLIHGIWGVKYALTAKGNAHPTDGSKPALPQYPRNHAYSWQRITSWLLLFGILAHVIHMRFLEYPEKVTEGANKYYAVRVTEDARLSGVTQQLHAHLQPDAQGKLKLLAPNPGTAFFFIVRESFKSPVIVVLYSLLVIFACFHAFNGVWTSLITWGVTLSKGAQRIARQVTNVLMGIVILLGLTAAWGTYWVMSW
jgi:succinate dehydrogenase / fumarate reductase, cytochrome b subunit